MKPSNYSFHHLIYRDFILYLTLGNNFLLGERRDYRDFNRQERIPIASTIGDTWDYENNLRVIIPGVPVDVSV